MSASTRLYKQSGRLPKYTPLPWKVFFYNVMAKDAVLWIALGLAAVSSICVRPPLAAYGDYIDFKTLGCLASLMAASGGFMISGVFDRAAAVLANACRGSRSLTTAMVFCVFFSSMLITNDVALIVFVPMTLLAFQRAGLDPMPAVILETVAANVGSMLLPMGNPQNLYLFSRFRMAFSPFLHAVLPLCLAGAALLALFCLFTARKPLRRSTGSGPGIRERDAWRYAALFLIAVLAVFDVLDWRAVLAVAIIVLAVRGRGLAQQIDYALLLTFIGFFIFVGNMSRVPAFGEWLREFVGPNPYLAAVLASQVISNVPAAVMLSGFTDNGFALLAGVSAGGCGTLIASMASLISYKLYIRTCGGKKRYLLAFTLVNILFLMVMSLAYAVCRG